MFPTALLTVRAPGEEYPNGAILCAAKLMPLTNHIQARKDEVPNTPANPSPSATATSAAASAASAAPPPSSNKVEMIFDFQTSKPDFACDPSFKITDTSGKETISPAATAFAYISDLPLEDIYKARHYVAQLKSFRKPTESQLRDLAKNHSDTFHNYSEKVEPGKVLSFLATSNPQAPFDAFDAIALILDQIDNLVEIAVQLEEAHSRIATPSSSASASASASSGSSSTAAGAAAGSASATYTASAESQGSTSGPDPMASVIANVKASCVSITSQIGRLSGALNNILGGQGISAIIADYIKSRKGEQPVCLMTPGESPTDIPKPAGSFLWPFLARAINFSRPMWRSRITADGRDAAEIAVAPLRISSEPGTFTDFESLKGKVGFWGYQRFRSPAYNALYNRAIHSFYKMLDTEYTENVAKGHNHAMYQTAMRFGHPLLVAPPDLAKRDAAAHGDAPSSKAPVKLCNGDGCTNRFQARKPWWKFCDVCRSKAASDKVRE